ncbi:MAG: ubiquitin carboxyl-terminal hydrolase family protein [Acidobacteriaceae bacterium]|nr:ubiquitin carboxyl-terminal hydrolase family protein [Acidobacteriaceae bacterium]
MCLRLDSSQTKAVVTRPKRSHKSKSGSSSKQKPKSVAKIPSPPPALEPLTCAEPGPETIRGHKGRPSGIQNIGNTCYLSSTLQCLKHTKLLCDYLQGDADVDATQPKGEFITALCKLMRALHNDGLSVSPFQFKRVIDKQTAQFASNKQCDAHEFLMFLLDRLHDEAKQDTAWSDLDSRIKEVFYGKFVSTIECLECKHLSVTYEPFMCVSLPIDDAAEELPLLLYTSSRHMFALVCKFDDESISIGMLKAEIKRQLIVRDLDIYLLLDNKKLERVADTTPLNQILVEKSWELYAIERDPQDLIPLPLVKLDLGKTSPPLILCGRPDLAELGATLTRLMARPYAIEDPAEMDAAPAPVSSGAFNLCNPVQHEDAGGVSYFQVEVKAASRSSHLSELIGKLPHQSVEIVRHRIGGEDCDTLQGCLTNFTSTERLQGLNQWSCESCKKFTDAHKKIEYGQLPRVLIIHLKRFKVRCKRNRIKISKLIRFPQTLQLDTVDKQQHTYRLYAVINHSGDTEHGHYTAYCKDMNGGEQWLLFDDSKVTPADPSQLDTSYAYVLFYEQTS